MRWLIAILLCLSLPSCGEPPKEQIAFLRLSSGFWQLWTMNPDGSEQKQVTQTPVDKVHAAWRPASSEILYHNQMGESYLLDTTTGRERPVLEGIVTHNASWNVEGERLAFSVQAWGPPLSSLWVSDLEGADKRKIADRIMDAVGPAWLSHDVIVHKSTQFDFNRGFADEFWELALHLENAQRQIPYDDEPLKLDLAVVTVSVEQAEDEVGKLAYSSLRSGFFEIWTFDLRTKKPRQLTHLEAYAGAPSWSPDGRSLAFDSNSSGNLHIYRINADGEGLVQLTKGDAPSVKPVWSH